MEDKNENKSNQEEVKSENSEDTLKNKLNKHGQLEDEGAPEDEI